MGRATLIWQAVLLGVIGAVAIIVLENVTDGLDVAFVLGLLIVVTGVSYALTQTQSSKARLEQHHQNEEKV